MKTPRRVRPVVSLLACVVSLAVVRTSAQTEFTRIELTVSPYLLVEGQRDVEVRINRRERLAAAAETAGDFARAARHFSHACQGRATLTGKPGLESSACQKARQLSRDHGVVDVAIGLQIVDGMLRTWSFDFQGAVNVLRAAIASAAQLNPDQPDGTPVNAAHQMLGSVLIERGEFDEAQREITFARDHCRVSGHAGCVAFSEIYLCRLHTMLGNYGPARTACDSARAVAAIENDRIAAANLEWMQGTLEAALGRHQEALVVLQKAWQHAQMRGTELLQPIMAQLITDALIRLNRIAEAEQWQAGTDEGLKSGRIPFFFGPQAAMRRAQIAVYRGRFDEAQTAFEASSRSLIHEMSIRGHFGVALVSRLRGDLPAARAALEQAITKIERGRTNTSGAALRAGYLTLHARAYGELIGIRFDSEGAAAANDALQIAEQGRARSLLDALSSAQVVGAAAPTLSASDVQATLADEEVLIEYVSLENRMFAVTVTRDRIAITRLPQAGTASELNKRVDFFSALIQETDEASTAPAARRLYVDVLAPALEGVPASARTLIIAADGPLHRLPFDAIGDGSRVIDRWDVVTLPSASALATRTRRAAPTEAALVVAAPADTAGLGMLAAAPAEAAAIRARVGGRITELSGAGATQQKLETSGLEKYAVVHFASHALVDETRPLQSALILAPGTSGNDRQWTAEEIYRTPMNADLVVLSACSTAAGAQTPGEGVMSLARAFLYAGAGATVATLWDVPDAPGPVFADVLYRELAAGRPLGAAVADARRELRRLGAPPQAWAAYVLTGKPGAVVGVKPPVNRSLLLASVAGGFAVMLMVIALLLRFKAAAIAMWRLRWPVPAFASALLIAVAAWQLVPPSQPQLDAVSQIERSGSGAVLQTTVAADRVAWSPVAGADEHVVSIFDGDGMPIGDPVVTASPFTTPADAQGGWIRVEALQEGLSIARSTLIRIPAASRKP